MRYRGQVAIQRSEIGGGIQTLLWREASIATDIDGFLARAGGSVLDALDATAVTVRRLDREARHLDTVAAIRRGALGVAHPTRPRTELTAAATARIAAWVEAGALARPGPRGATAVARDLLRGVGDPSDGDWWLVPLAGQGGAQGALLVSADHPLEPRRVAEISEPLAAVLATELWRRELHQLREAAEAAKAPADAALLEAHDGPGHVRERSAVIEGAAILGEGTRPAGDAFPIRFPTLDEAMRRHIEAALVRCKGRIEGEHGAARLLGIHANTLRSRMHKLGIRWERFR